MPGLGSVVDTESYQSSENRDIGASPEDSLEEERQRTGLFRWDDPENLMPSWSVPPGLIVPGPRHPEANAQPPGPAPQPPGPAPQPPGSAPQPDAEEPASGDSPWPGVAPPAGWFLRAASPPVARQESASARESEGDQPAQPFASPAPGSGTPGLRDEAPAEPEPSAPAAPTSLWPGAIAWPSASPSPSPARALAPARARTPVPARTPAADPHPPASRTDPGPLR